jgi:hypothetical protein
MWEAQDAVATAGFIPEQAHAHLDHPLPAESYS